MQHLYLFDQKTEALVYGPDTRAGFSQELLDLILARNPGTLPYVLDFAKDADAEEISAHGRRVAPTIADGKITAIAAQPYDYQVELHVSDDGFTWTGAVEIDLGAAAYFRIRIHPGASSVAAIIGSARRLPVYFGGTDQLRYKKVTFADDGSGVAQAIKTWTPAEATEYVVRPQDILAAYPAKYPQFLTGAVKIIVAD